MRVVIAACLLLVGCRQVFGLADPAHATDGGADADDAGGGDDAVDSGLPYCYGSPSTVCLAAPPTGVVTLGAGILDTDSDVRCKPFTSPQIAAACVVVGGTLSPNATLHVVGSRPLILLAVDTLTIPNIGTVDVASYNVGLVGPAADPPDCTAGLPATTATTSGGGAGGSFGTIGGGGGKGGMGGVGATSGPLNLAATLRGGCSGSKGAHGAGGLPGKGGGAVLLIANSMVIHGDITACGAPGTGGVDSGDGGGGGGAGGMIVFEAASVFIDGHVWANGGGGGEGAGGSISGDPGVTSPNPMSAGNGGVGGSANGGNGGDGAYASMPAVGGVDGSNNGGGGGGGGGVGVIQIHSASVTGVAPSTVSPPPASIIHACVA